MARRGSIPEALREQAIDTLRGGVRVTQSGQSYVLWISYTSSGPHEAARIANGIAEAYIDVQLDEKLSATRRASIWLADQVEQLRWRVFGSELAIEEFRAAKGLVDTDPSGLDSQQLALITNSLIDARAERSAQEARLYSLRAMRASGQGLESAAEVLSSPLILNLRAREMEIAREEAQLSQEYGSIIRASSSSEPSSRSWRIASRTRSTTSSRMWKTRWRSPAAASARTPSTCAKPRGNPG